MLKCPIKAGMPKKVRMPNKAITTKKLKRSKKWHIDLASD